MLLLHTILLVVVSAHLWEQGTLTCSKHQLHKRSLRKPAPGRSVRIWDLVRQFTLNFQFCCNISLYLEPISIFMFLFFSDLICSRILGRKSEEGLSRCLLGSVPHSSGIMSFRAYFELETFLPDMDQRQPGVRAGMDVRKNAEKDPWLRESVFTSEMESAKGGLISQGYQAVCDNMPENVDCI